MDFCFQMLQLMEYKSLHMLRILLGVYRMGTSLQECVANLFNFFKAIF